MKRHLEYAGTGQSVNSHTGNRDCLDKGTHCALRRWRLWEGADAFAVWRSPHCPARISSDRELMAAVEGDGAHVAGQGREGVLAFTALAGKNW